MDDRTRASITRLLADEGLNDGERARQLLPLVYDELRRMAHASIAGERPGHTLEATALVHEAYIRLTGDKTPRWQDRTQFFADAAEAMRRILVEQARRRAALKRGGDRRRVELADAHLEGAIELEMDADDLVALDEALGALEAEDQRKATLVKLRFFTGVTLDQAAAALGISPATADRDWAYAKAFLYAEVRRRRDA